MSSVPGSGGGFGGGGGGFGSPTIPSRGVFISHAASDKDLSDAFAGLIQDVTAGLIPTYASSSTDGTVGVPYGDDWFNWIQDKIRASGNVVALITPESVGRPWILFEAGFGKAIEGTKVFGLRLGISGEDAYDGPFKGLQNSGSDAQELKKLCRQLLDGVCNPRDEMISTCIDQFLQKVSIHFENSKIEPKKQNPESEAVFRALEEIKMVVRESRQGPPDDEFFYREKDYFRLFEYGLHHSEIIKDAGLRVSIMLGLLEEFGLGFLSSPVRYALDHKVDMSQIEKLFFESERMFSRNRKMPVPPDMIFHELMRDLAEHQARRFVPARARGSAK